MRPFWLFVFIFALIVGFHRSTTNIADKSFLFNIQKFIYWIFYLFCHLSFQFTVDPSHNLDDDEVHNTQQHYLVLVVHFKLYLKIFTNFIQISSTTNFYTSTNSYHKLTKPTVLTNKKLLNTYFQNKFYWKAEMSHKSSDTTIGFISLLLQSSAIYTATLLFLISDL